MTTKSNGRTGKPVETNVPWGQADAPEHPEPEFIDPMAALPLDGQAAENLGETGSKLGYNPFKQKAPVEKAPEPEQFDDTGAPKWGEFVQFIMKHGKDIAQARHPRPLGEVVDTLWKGVRVLPHEKCQIQHMVHGWIDWQDAISE